MSKSGLSAALAGFVRWVMRDATYRRAYSATVERDHGDGSFDVRPEDAALRGLGLERVRAAVGVAGASVSARPGSRCLVSFSNADPSSPYIAAWEYARRMGTVSLAGGSAGLARVGDVVKVLTEPVLVVTGIAGGIQDTPNPSPPPATIPVPWPAGTPFAGAATIATPISGVIQQGAQRLRA